MTGCPMNICRLLSRLQLRLHPLELPQTEYFFAHLLQFFLKCDFLLSLLPAHSKEHFVPFDQGHVFLPEFFDGLGFLVSRRMQLLSQRSDRLLGFDVLVVGVFFRVVLLP